MYGLPKLMELERTRSPGYTCLVFESPSGLIFSEVEVMYRPMLGASPIFTQFSPAGSSVIYVSIGRGDPPRSIRTRSENLRCSQGSVKPAKRISGTLVFSATLFTSQQFPQLSNARHIVLVTRELAQHRRQLVFLLSNLVAYVRIGCRVLCVQCDDLCDEIAYNSIGQLEQIRLQRLNPLRSEQFVALGVG